MDEGAVGMELLSLKTLCGGGLGRGGAPSLETLKNMLRSLWIRTFLSIGANL
jgi:hypothetical protein